MDEINWTENQKLVFDLKSRKNGCFVVKACPGSGKTACVSERLFRFIEEWDNPNAGIAVLSFTKVALEEISKNYEERSGNSKVPYPHYLGTLDSFINKFIFLPHSHLVMGYDKKPTFVGQPYSSWTGTNDYDKFFDKLTFSKDGKLVRKLAPPHTFPNDSKFMYNVRKNKRNLFKKGFVIQADANYYAMDILQKFPHIAKMIANRFPYLIIDEAQDTSEIHMEIINLLIDNGLKNVMLVGDPEQAIFEWNEAKPDLFNEKFDEWDNSIVLDTNFRSSTKICNFMSHLSELDTIISGNLVENDIPPKIIGYSDDYESIINNFLEECESNGIDISKDSVAILSRGKKDISKIRNKKFYYLNKCFRAKDFHKISYTENIIKGKYLWDNGNILEGFNYLEKAFIQIKYASSDNIADKIKEEIKYNGFCNHRSNVYEFISLLPNVTRDQLVQIWINTTTEILKNSKCNVDLNNITLGQNKLYEFLTFDMLFPEDNPNDYYSGTIHSVKGGSFDAVLIIFNSRFSNEKKYIKMFNEGDLIKNSEPLRVIYVAISRPKQLLRIAVPEEDCSIWKKRFGLNEVEIMKDTSLQSSLDFFSK